MPKPQENTIKHSYGTHQKIIRHKLIAVAGEAFNPSKIHYPKFCIGARHKLKCSTGCLAKYAQQPCTWIGKLHQTRKYFKDDPDKASFTSIP